MFELLHFKAQSLKFISNVMHFWISVHLLDLQLAMMFSERNNGLSAAYNLVTCASALIPLLSQSERCSRRKCLHVYLATPFTFNTLHVGKVA